MIVQVDNGLDRKGPPVVERCDRFTTMPGGTKLYRICIVAKESNVLSDLGSGLALNGFSCHITPPWNGFRKQITEQPPDLMLVEIDNPEPNPMVLELCQRIKREEQLPIIALLGNEILENIDGNLDTDDFITSPYDLRELVLRIKRLLQATRSNDSSELIRCGDLIIDTARCEVSLGGQRVALTFREYELLKFLAGNKGRVFTREVLLDKVWGYDYFGGDRTVDVHIRRLRSKIEDSSHAFIDTVRNIGYRFMIEVL